jgi:hypothetical protein
MSVPAWAQFSLGCPAESRNGCYEYDISDYDGSDYDGTGFGGGSDGAVDHWSFGGSGAVTWYNNVAFDHTHLANGLNPGGNGSHSIRGQNCAWVWQIVDETRASWYADSQLGWQHGNNPCWIPEGTSKTIASTFYAYFTEGWNVVTGTGQMIRYGAWEWTNAGAPTVDFDPTVDQAASGWSYVGGSFATGVPGAWQNYSFQITMPDSQPRYVAWAYHFLDNTTDNGGTDGPIYLDDVTIEGECHGDNSPELSTWLLLAATGAFGGVVRRRRKT